MASRVLSRRTDRPRNSVGLVRGDRPGTVVGSAVKRIESGGPIEVGGNRRNHPVSGPSARFVYSAVTRPDSYTEVSSAPGARFAFTHLLTELPDGRLRITHGAEVPGP